jgi:transposase-like protein
MPARQQLRSREGIKEKTEDQIIEKIKTKEGFQRYTSEEKIKALQAVIATGYNISLAAKQVGMDRKTISVWTQMYSMTAAREGILELVVQLVNEDIEKKKERFEKAAYDVKEYILTKVHARAKNEKDLDKLSRALRVVHDVGTTKVEMPDPNDNNPQSIIAFMTSQIILHQSQKKDTNGTAGN